jgi:RimJ/RimL family protein N-acetyltransferase
MQHALQSEGFGVRLRPVRLEDAAFIVWLRNLQHAKGRIGDSAADDASQEAWLRTYFDRQDDYYFVIETLGGIAVGTYGLWDFKEGSAESGRWVTRPEVPAAIGSAILGLDLAFETLGLKEIRVKTVTTNAPVLSLNRKFGMKQTFVEANSQMIGGKMVAQVHFVLSPQDWKAARERLLPLARLAERQVLEWEQEEGRKVR